MRLLFILFATAWTLQAQDLGPSKDDPSVPKDSDTILRIQIFLDKNLFGPGKLDGAIGEFTYKAVVNYNYAHGVKQIYDWSRVQAAAEKDVPVLFAAFKIPAALLKFINKELPNDPAKQAEFPYMAYRSLSELIAERFHTDETFLAKVNPGKNIDSMKAGEVVVVPNVRSFKVEEVKPMQSYKEDKTLSTHTIVVDTIERMAAVYTENEMMLAAFPITPGKPQFIPVAQWSVKTIMNTPSFRYDKQFLEEGVRGDAVPWSPIPDLLIPHQMMPMGLLGPGGS